MHNFHTLEEKEQNNVAFSILHSLRPVNVCASLERDKTGLLGPDRRPHPPGSPGVRELKAGEAEDPSAAGAVVIVHKLLQFHLAVLLLGDVCHIHAPLWAWGGGEGGEHPEAKMAWPPVRLGQDEQRGRPQKGRPDTEALVPAVQPRPLPAPRGYQEDPVV